MLAWGLLIEELRKLRDFGRQSARLHRLQHRRRSFGAADLAKGIDKSRTHGVLAENVRAAGRTEIDFLVLVKELADGGDRCRALLGERLQCLFPLLSLLLGERAVR